MRRCRPMLLAIAATGLALATSGVAHAHEGPAPASAPGQMPITSPSREMMPPQAREVWLAECHRRLSRHDRRDRGPDRCEAWLDDYYAYYRNLQTQPGMSPWAVAPGQFAYGQPAPCCQPMAMVPPTAMQPLPPKCNESVEYEYVEVPVRTAPRARAHRVRRIWTAPDKRVRLK